MRVAVSGKSGCGNSTVSRLVARQLGLRLINFTFRELAVECGVSFAELHRRAAAANWLLTEADLTVYLAGTPEVRARRIAAREGVPYATALATMNARDAQDRGRYLALYDIDIDNYRHADLVLDTAALDQFQVAAAIVGALER